MLTKKLRIAACLALAGVLGPSTAHAVSEPLFSFVALGDLPYGSNEKSYANYRALIDRINRVQPVFSVHVGDIKSGSSECSDQLYTEQLEMFGRFEGAVVYTPGDNEWTDCHRISNGRYNPIERLSVLRQRFFTPGRSLGAVPIRVDNQSNLMPAHAAFVENQRWMHRGVLFATVHIVGSNNNFESRDAQAVQEFFGRDAANVAWIEAAFAHARQRQARALVLAFQADMFESRSVWEDFPASSGFQRSIQQTLLPLARSWGRPVLVVHGDSHRFRIDQPFTLEGQPLTNITRLIVPGANDVRAVHVRVGPDSSFKFELLEPLR
ncbi:MAG: hypothetical protein ACKODC_11340 [Limnohabitans sp.]